MRMRRSLALVMSALAIVGCAPQGPYRAGQDSSERFVADQSLCPKLQTPSGRDIRVAYVEIDEQGSFQDRRQVEQAISLASDDRTKRKYVVVYAHGWFHNASPADTNVRRFKCALDALQAIPGNAEEEVIGVYLGWRGESWTLPLLRYATFWERKNTSEEIGRGSLVEFLTRLERAVKPHPESSNKLMLVGHSFGASVVFNSIGQLLLARFLLDAEKLASEARTPAPDAQRPAAKEAPAHSQSKPGLVSGYGDLVVLVNPAIEATRIVPFFTSLNEYTTREPDLLSPSQPPRLVILSSEGDRATRMVFPAARVVSTLLESYEDRLVRTPYRQDLAFRSRHLDWQTMGNADVLHTHDPLRESTPERLEGKCPGVQREWLRAAIKARQDEQRAKGEPPTGAGWSLKFNGAAITLTHRGITTPSNPLWILAVGTRLIAEHSEIAGPAMICLFDELLGDPEVVKREGVRHLEQRGTK
jgi:hypothetical protein